jgi:GT2 family glycosyltransferase
VNDAHRTAPHRVSVVIPTWNGRDLLASCLESLNAQTFRDFDARVVDDGSTDDTAAMLERRFPHVRVIRFPQNRGFCAAVNAGIARAEGNLIVLLNNDMTLAPGFLEHLVAAADASDAALFAPLILWRDDPFIIYAAGDQQLANGRPVPMAFRCSLEEFEFSKEVFGVSAGAALYRREVFDTIGTFDPYFNIYFSDSDVSFRARLAGFKAEFMREAVAYHVGSASLLGKTLKRTRQCYVNHALLVIKNMPWALLVRHGPAILAERVHQTRRLFSAARTERGAMRAAAILLSAWMSMWRRLPHAVRERRRIQKSRKISLTELEALLTR